MVHSRRCTVWSAAHQPHAWRSVYLLLTWALTTLAQTPAENLPDGYVGGPYKLLATDVNGDGRSELVVGYRSIGVVTVEQIDDRGQLQRIGLNALTVPVPLGARHVHNLDDRDLNGDGLIDLALTLGGSGPTQPGRILLATNRGRGRFQPVVEYTVPSEAKGIRLADLDNDGQLDLLYTARGSGYKGDIKVGRLYLRRGLGAHEFGPALVCDAGKSAYYVETADLNSDGFLDIVIPNEHDSTVTYFINPGMKLFEQRQPPTRAQVRATQIPGRRSHAVNDVRAADFNGDGHLDLITANLGTSTLSLFLGKGDGTFHPDQLLEGGKNGAFLAVGDLDRDGDLDLVVTHWTEDFLSVLLNQSDGKFAPRQDYQTGSGNYGVTLLDFNQDGKLDAATANYRAESVSVLAGQGDGTFQPAVTTRRGLRSFNGKWHPH